MSNNNDIRVIKPVPRARTKKTFYIAWILFLVFPLLLSIGEFLGGFFQDEKQRERHPDDWPIAVVWLLATLQLLAHLTLLYYLGVRVRALFARVSTVHQAAAAASQSGPGRGSRWLIGFGRQFDSAMEMEDWFLDGENLKGAGILLGLSTVWFIAVGAATMAMFVMMMFLGKGLVGLVLLLGVVVFGFSFVGHLGYVWVRSVKVLVVGAWRRGRGGRRPPGRDVEEGDDDHGERLLPLGGDAEHGAGR